MKAPRHELELLERILTSLPALSNGWLACTRTDLCKALCHHPGREGSVTTLHLDEFIPKLVAAGFACEIPRPGKPPSYVFRPITRAEARWREPEILNEIGALPQTPNQTEEAALNRLVFERSALKRAWPFEPAAEFAE
jgi:hypothetical protein